MNGKQSARQKGTSGSRKSSAEKSQSKKTTSSPEKTQGTLDKFVQRKASLESQGDSRKKPRSRGNSAVSNQRAENAVMTDQNKQQRADPKKPSKQLDFMLSKKQPTHLNTRCVAPLIHEKSQRVFVASGYTILVYCLQTGFCTHVLRDTNSGSGLTQVHHGNIILLEMLESAGTGLTLLSVCSAGVVAKWHNVEPEYSVTGRKRKRGEDRAVMQSLSDDKEHAVRVRAAVLDKDAETLILSLEDDGNRKFVGVDVDRLSRKWQLPQITYINHPITGMVARSNMLAYIVGKAIVIERIESASADRIDDHHTMKRVLSLQSKPTCIALSPDGGLIAVGDEYGKIFVVRKRSERNDVDADGEDESDPYYYMQSLQHWHSNAVSCLHFVQAGATSMLLSAGRESVLVQWNLATNERTFVSRLGGGAIASLAVFGDYYACIFGDNSIKVLRFDNNKPIINHQNLNLKASAGVVSNYNSQILEPVGSSDLGAEDGIDSLGDLGNMLAFVAGDKVQFKPIMGGQGSSLGPSLSHSHCCNPRNYTSSAIPVADEELLPSYTVRSLAFSPSGEHMVSIECLEDSQFANKQVFIWTLKVWERSATLSDEGSPYRLAQMVHSPYAGPLSDSEQRNGHVKPLVNFVSASFFILAFRDTAQFWQLRKVSAQDKLKYRWQVVRECRYSHGAQDGDASSIVQLHTGVKLRLKGYQKVGSQRCVAMLHQGPNLTGPGRITFWREGTFEFVHQITFKSPIVKVVFEKSYRYMAALTTEGAVEVWSLHHNEEAHLWSLNFTSIADIEASRSYENQFFVLMNSSDHATSPLDSLLLFQFSRPQKLINFWKFQQVPIRQMRLVSWSSRGFHPKAKRQHLDTLILIDANGEVQKLHVGVTKAALKTYKQHYQNELHRSHTRATTKVQNQQFTDFAAFTSLKPKKQTTAADRLIDSMVAEAENDAWAKKRKAMALNVDLEGDGFLTGLTVQQSVDGFFEATLAKPSTATSLLKLQEEFESLQIGRNSELLNPQDVHHQRSTRTVLKEKEAIASIIDQIEQSTK